MSTDVLPELYAACIVEYARQQDNSELTGPSYVIVKDARDSFNLPYDETLFRDAMSILTDLDALKQYKHQGIQTYYKIDAKAFASSMKEGTFGVRSYRVGIDFESPTFALLESFADLGSDFLAEALESYEHLLAEVGKNSSFEWTDVSPPFQDSSAWTGLPSDIELSETRRAELMVLLDDAERALDAVGSLNSEKAMARAYIIAAKTLADTPSPPVDLIWEMVNRANQLCGITSLFVSIFAFFAAVGS